MERLPKTPDDTRGARWGALQAEHEAVAEWVAGLDGERAVVGVSVGLEYAYTGAAPTPRGSAPSRVGSPRRRTPRCAQRSSGAKETSRCRRGTWSSPSMPAEAKPSACAAQGWDRGVALAAGLRADVLEARGQLDEALRIRREEELPVYERLGDVHSKAVTMGQIADVLQARGSSTRLCAFGERRSCPSTSDSATCKARRARWARSPMSSRRGGSSTRPSAFERDEVLPVFERLGDVRGQGRHDGQNRRQCFRPGAARRGPPHMARRSASRLRAARGRSLQGRHDGQDRRRAPGPGQLDEALRMPRVTRSFPSTSGSVTCAPMAVTMSKIADILQAQGSSTRPCACGERKCSRSSNDSATCAAKPSRWGRSPTCSGHGDSVTRPGASTVMRCFPSAKR
jgi:hypothetical protein